jgi:hypothetical protein
MNSDTERLVELAKEISERLGDAFQGMIPPDAQRHLLNAQRELLTAVFLIYEHQMGARRQRPAPEPSDDGLEDDEEAPPAPRRRVSHIEVE